MSKNLTEPETTMEDPVKALALAALATLIIASASSAWAHGDEPHPKCKKGYELNEQHKCVKKN
jgi:hypothetical protein